MGIYDKIFKPKKLVLSDGKVVEEKRTRTRSEERRVGKECLA